MQQTISKIGALRKYFGFKPGQTLAEFANEIRELSESEQLELAELAAQSLGKVLAIK